VSEDLQRFVIEKDGDGFTARKPGVYGVEVGNGLGIEGAGGFVPLYEVKEQPGKPLPNRRDRRAWAREAAKQLNHTRHRRVVAIQREDG
jgi:hypothetical protein